MKPMWKSAPPLGCFSNVQGPHPQKRRKEKLSNFYPQTRWAKKNMVYPDGIGAVDIFDISLSENWKRKNNCDSLIPGTPSWQEGYLLRFQFRKRRSTLDYYLNWDYLIDNLNLKIWDTNLFGNIWCTIWSVTRCHWR